MTGGERIRAALTLTATTTAAGTRVRQDAADEDDNYPFIIFRRYEVDRLTNMDGSLAAAKETFQIECWGKDREQSDLLEAQVVAALQASSFFPSGNEPDGLDPEVKVRAAVLMVDVWTTYCLGM